MSKRWWWPAMVAVASVTAACSDDGGQLLPPSTAEASTTLRPSCETPPHNSIREGLDQVVTVLMFCDDNGRHPEGTALVPVERLVPADRDPLDATILQVLLGTTPAEAAVGLSSIGDTYLASTYIETTVDDGVAVVHLRDSFTWKNNISTSNVSAYVMRMLEANVFQYPEVTGLDFLVGGERWCGLQNPCYDDDPFPYFTPP